MEKSARISLGTSPCLCHWSRCVSASFWIFSDLLFRRVPVLGSSVRKCPVAFVTSAFPSVRVRKHLRVSQHGGSAKAPASVRKSGRMQPQSEGCGDPGTSGSSRPCFWEVPNPCAGFGLAFSYPVWSLAVASWGWANGLQRVRQGKARFQRSSPDRDVRKETTAQQTSQLLTEHVCRSFWKFASAGNPKVKFVKVT